jgi:hypothetical protein
MNLTLKALQGVPKRTVHSHYESNGRFRTEIVVSTS